MNRNDFKSMSTDELWALHEEIATQACRGTDGGKEPCLKTA